MNNAYKSSIANPPYLVEVYALYDFVCFSRRQGQVTFFPLTGDMEVEYDPVKAQSVVCCSRNLVDANFTVDMLDPVVDGAYIHIRYSGSITKVHCYTCHGAKTLAKEKKILSLTL